MKKVMAIDINVIILIITFIAITWTAIETRRIANETIRLNLKPLIFRSGQIVGWKILSLEDMKQANNLQPTLEFTNLKNTATDITGYIILDNKKYNLVFNGNVRGANLENNGVMKAIYNVKWSWLPQNGGLLATYEKNKFEISEKKNQIYLLYKDIQGNSYYSSEDENFSPLSEIIEKQISF